MKQALVTGSEGFLARHLIPKLKADGYEVAGFDTKVGLPIQNWLHMLKHTKFDLIVHMAANIEDLSVRMKGGIGMFADIALDLMMANFVENNPPREAYVMMSSCALDYPDDPYCWTKLTVERLAKQLDKQKIPTVVLRPYSGYGEDQAETYPFPAILSRALAHEDPLTVWGALHTVRDFVHVDDVTDAIVHGIHHFPHGEPVPICTGRPSSMESLARAIAKAVGYSPEIVALADKPTGALWRVGDPTLAEKYGWKAKVTLEDGASRAVANRRIHSVTQ